MARALYEQTEGNPLFLTEIVRLLVRDGVLGGDRRPQPGDVIPIPEGIREVIGRRLNQLSEATNRVLSIASAIGREFTGREIAAVIDDLSQEQVTEALSEAAGGWVIEEAPQSVDRYQFIHALIRETLYDELSSTQRVRLHLRIGEALEGMYANDLGAHLGQLAYHFLEAAAGRAGRKAFDYAMKAGEQAHAMRAYEEAARHFDLALQVLDLVSQEPTMERCEALLCAGRAHASSANYHNAMVSFVQAGKVARELQWAEGMAEAAIGFEDAGWRPGLPGGFAVRMLEEALQALEERDSFLRARAMGALVRALHFSGHFEQATLISTEAIAMARRLGDLRALAWAIAMTYLPDEFRPEVRTAEERLKTSEELIAMGRSTDNMRVVLDTWTWRILDLIRAGRVGQARRELDELDHETEALREPFGGYIVKSCRAMLAIAEGHFREAEDLIAQGHVLDRRIHGQDFMGVLGMQMFTLRREQGRLAELAPVVRVLVSEKEQESIWRPGLAVLCAEVGMLDEARATYEEYACTTSPTSPATPCGSSAWPTLPSLPRCLGTQTVHRFCTSNYCPTRPTTSLSGAA